MMMLTKINEFVIVSVFEQHYCYMYFDQNDFVEP